MENQNSAPPPPDPAAPPAGGEEGRVKSLDDRFGKIETEQQRQGGILERIEQALSGPKAPAASTGAGVSTGSSSGSPSGDSPGPSVAEQVRAGVEKIEAEKKRKAEAEAATAADAAWRQKVDEQLAESRPAQPTTGRKSKIQRVWFGKADER